MKNQPMTPEIKHKIFSWIRGVFFGMFGFAAVVLLSAGKWDWLWGWVYIGILTPAMAAHVFVLVPINPALLADRTGNCKEIKNVTQICSTPE